jgi:hypothetical protein
MVQGGAKAVLWRSPEEDGAGEKAIDMEVGPARAA